MSTTLMPPPRRTHVHPATAPQRTVRVACAGGGEIDPVALERLESLDDIFFAALRGDANALDQARTILRRVTGFVPTSLLEEARDKYSERAEAVWTDYRSGRNTDVVRAFAALDVLLLLGDTELV